MGRANQAHAAGRFAECERLGQQIIEAEPNNIPALVLLGVSAAKTGSPERAVHFFEQAIAADHRCAPAHQWLSMVFRSLGRRQEALNSAQQVIRLNPNDALGMHHLGTCQMDLGQFSQAESSFRRAQSLAPNVPVIYASLGLVLRRLQRNSEAIAALRQSLKLEPGNILALRALRESLMEEDDPAGAVECARKLADLMPDAAEENLWLARLLMDAQKTAEAEQYLDRALKLEPGGSMAQMLLGSAMQVKGNLDAADKHFRRSIELLPNQGSAYSALVLNRRMTALDLPLIEKMRVLAGSTDLLPLDQGQIHYALGKAMEDLGEYQEAMRHYDEANRMAYQLKFGSRPYDRRPLTKWYDQIIHDFTAKYFAKPHEMASNSDLPILVVGMIRSGTTLAEQILSSHPEVGAAGELRTWLETVTQVPMGPEGPELFALQRMTTRYEKLLRETAPGKSRVVDKMPMNYQAIGYIHTAMPNAKIVHMQRNPVDTCLSIYATPNRSRIRWANDKSNIVFAYEQYERLMEHWRRELPPGVMTEVRYEDLVSDPEATTRALIEACGLAWNDACLRPEKNERAVVTPSVWQVRQPVYKSSMGRGARFGPWLGAFAKLKGG